MIWHEWDSTKPQVSRNFHALALWPNRAFLVLVF